MGDPINWIIVVACVVVTLTLAWDNRHHRHIWRDKDEE